MEEIAGLIDALIAEYRRRNAERRPGQRAPAFSAVLGDVLKARFGPPAAPGTRPAELGSRPAAGSRAPRPAAPQQGAGPANAGPAPASTGAAPRAIAERAPAQPLPREARLVTGLFANPQSLVAAFIVAEIIAPPVALRAPDQPRSALHG